MEEFLLKFRHGNGSKMASPKQMQKWMQQTMNWLGDIATQDKLMSRGNGLSFDDARIVTHDDMVNRTGSCFRIPPFEFAHIAIALSGMVKKTRLPNSVSNRAFWLLCEMLKKR